MVGSLKILSCARLINNAIFSPGIGAFVFSGIGIGLVSDLAVENGRISTTEVGDLLPLLGGFNFV